MTDSASRETRPGAATAPGMLVHTNWTGVAFGFLVAALAAFQQFKLPPMLPSMLAEFDYPKTLAGAFMSIYAAVGLVASVALGRGIARFGTTPFLAAAFLLALAGNALALAMPADARVVLTARALEGLAFAVFAIAGPVLTNRNASAAHLPMAIALSALWIPVGQIAAAAVVPISEVVLGWRLAWLATAGATVLLGLWGIAIWAGMRIDLDMRAPSGAKPVRITAAERRLLLLAAATFTLWSTQYFAYMTWLPQFLVERHHLDPGTATIGYSIPVVTLIVVGLLCGRLIRRGWRVGPLMVGSLVLEIGVWITMPFVDGLAGGLASLLVYGVGIGISPVCLFALPSTILGSARTGPSAFAVLMTGRNLGVLIGPIAAPQVLLLAGSWEASGPVFAAITVADLGLALLITRMLARIGRARPS